MEMDRPHNEYFGNYLSRLIQKPSYPIICISVVILQAIVLAASYDMTPKYPLWLRFSSDKCNEIYRLLTYAFGHHNIAHFAVNAIMQLIAIPLEAMHGHARYIAIWVSSAIVAVMIAREFGLRSAVGASGACYGLLGARIGNIILNGDDMKFVWLRVAGLAAVIAVDILNYIYNRSESISYVGHAAGLIWGVLFSVCMLKNLNERLLEFRAYVACAAACVGCITFCVISYYFDCLN